MRKKTMVVYFILAVILVSLFVFLTKVSAESSIIWDKTYGGTNYERAHSLVVTSDGGYAIAGSISVSDDGIDFGLVKADTSGNMVWQKTYGETFEDTPSSVIQTSDGGYALVGFSSSFNGTDVWLVKTDANGNMEWSQTYGGTGDDAASSIVQTSDGGYAIAADTTSFGAGGYDFWLVKTDASGNMMWSQTYGGTEFDRVSSLVVTSDGGYALVGFSGRSLPAGGGDSWLVKTDASGNMMWNQTYGGTNFDSAYSLVVTSDGGYAMVGFTSSFGAGGGDFWLVKTDASGNMMWSQTYGGAEDERAHSLVVTSDGGYALAGYTSSFGAGSADFWLVKTDASGNMMWNQTCGGTGDDYAFSLVVTSDGGYAVAGETGSFGAGGGDFWLVKIEVEDMTEPPPTGALQMEYVYVVVAVVVIAVVVIGIVAYKKRK